MTKRILALTFFALALPGISAFSQQEGPTPTQALVSFDSKAPVSPTAKDVTIKVDNRPSNLLNLAPIPPNGAQVALLIDDGLRTSIGGELNNLRAFITSLPCFWISMRTPRIMCVMEIFLFSPAARNAAVITAFLILPPVNLNWRARKP